MRRSHHCSLWPTLDCNCNWAWQSGEALVHKGLQDVSPLSSLGKIALSLEGLVRRKRMWATPVVWTTVGDGNLETNTVASLSSERHYVFWSKKSQLHHISIVFSSELDHDLVFPFSLFHFRSFFPLDSWNHFPYKWLPKSLFYPLVSEKP